MINLQNILSVLLIFPLIGVIFLMVIPHYNHLLLKITALFFSFVTFIISLLLWVWFDESTGFFQYVDVIYWIFDSSLFLTLGIDGISLFFVILTTLLIPLCLLTSWDSVNTNLKKYLICFLVMETFLIGVFCVLDVLIFYIFFESVLIPMFLIIGI